MEECSVPREHALRPHGRCDSRVRRVGGAHRVRDARPAMSRRACLPGDYEGGFLPGGGGRCSCGQQPPQGERVQLRRPLHEEFNPRLVPPTISCRFLRQEAYGIWCGDVAHCSAPPLVLEQALEEAAAPSAVPTALGLSREPLWSGSVRLPRRRVPSTPSYPSTRWRSAGRRSQGVDRSSSGETVHNDGF